MTLVTTDNFDHNEYEHRNSGGHWVEFQDGYRAGRLTNNFSFRFMDNNRELARAYGVTAHNVCIAILRDSSDRYLRLLRDGIDDEIEMRKIYSRAKK